MTSDDFRNFESDLKALFEPTDYLYFYEEAFSNNVVMKQIAFLETQFDMTPPLRILDIGCGNGAVSRALAQKGNQVTGVDFIEGLISIARSKGEAGITYLLRDYRDMGFNSEFDIVLVMRTGFGHYDDDANLAVLSNISRALKPGGHCFLDLPNRDFFIRNFLPYIVVEKEDSLMVDINAFDALSSRLYTKRIVVRNGEVKKKPSFLRFYSSTEMRSLLASVGMDVNRMVGAKDGAPYSLTSREMGVVAQKRP